MQRFMPWSFQADKVKQYLDLVQTPEMTVLQYTKKYEELCKYGKKYAPDDESKAEKYRDGILSSIYKMVIASRVRTYDDTVDMTLKLERGERNSRQYWDVQKGRKTSTISGSGGGKGSGPRDGKIVCFKCGREGYKKNQCTIMGVKCYGCGGRGRGGAKQQTTLTHGRAFALGHHEAPEHPNFIGDTPFGHFTLLEGVVLDCVCRFGSIALKAYLCVLDFKDFDVIFGVDWITSLITLAPRGDVATPTRVVEEYMNVFSDELPGLPPKREIDFTID
ncbi:uncharacterized protein LOC119992745 [Tripterygium wilfordii]|uniref:uncharacterized protein LOC119992745 n=1 Tax=Tripterygium wilfordii TaxID=458696 RepID=UPI0018F835B9|nr:uncharacterized protein LOC119992745 [Tripterygium wilfordii]